MSEKQAGVTAEMLASISTPDRVETRLGTLEFDDGAPTDATAALLYDNLDFMHGVEAFINSFPGASQTLDASHNQRDDRGTGPDLRSRQGTDRRRRPRCPPV